MQPIHEGDRVTDSTGQYHGKVAKIYDRFTVGVTWAGGTVPTVEHSVNLKLEWYVTAYRAGAPVVYDNLGVEEDVVIDEILDDGLSVRFLDSERTFVVDFDEVRPST